MTDSMTLSQLEGVYVQGMPRVNQTVRDGSVNPDWTPFMNSFDTWMRQASTPLELDEGLYAVRIGCVITVTGTVKAGKKIGIVGPPVTFSVDGVTFDKEGFINGGDEDKAVSVTYIARR